jgi:hypothetical protein
MRVETQWMIFVLAVQFASTVIKDNIGKGYITKIMMKVIKCPFELRAFFRILQLLVFYFLASAVKTPHDILYWLPAAILYIDDLFYQDGDWWKKKFEWVKNKIKWKQYKPAPVR